MKVEREVMAVVYKAKTPEGPWEPVKPENVPEWVKDSEVMGRLLQGMICMDKHGEIYIENCPDPLEYGSDWYAAQEIPAQEAMH